MSRPAFDLLILGSSSASPTSHRNPNAQLINIAERYFLVDCGEGTQIQLRRFKAKFQAIRHILISHLHGDHFFGLPGLLSSMHLLGRKTTLTVYGPPALQSLIETLNAATDTRLSYPIEWVATSAEGLQALFADDKVEVFSFPLKHRIHCTGFLFREKPLLRKIDKARLDSLCISYADIWALKNGLDVVNEKGELIRNAEATIDPPPPRSYAYCSDTVADVTLTNYISGVDLLFHESTFLDDHCERAASTFHSTATQAAEVARQAHAGKLLLGHFSARYPDLAPFLAEASAVFPNCELATDGKMVKI